MIREMSKTPNYTKNKWH